MWTLVVETVDAWAVFVARRRVGVARTMAAEVDVVVFQLPEEAPRAQLLNQVDGLDDSKVSYD